MVKDHLQYAHKWNENNHTSQSPNHRAKQQRHDGKKRTELNHSTGDFWREKITIDLLNYGKKYGDHDRCRQGVPGDEGVDHDDDGTANRADIGNDIDQCG